LIFFAPAAVAIGLVMRAIDYGLTPRRRS